MKALRFSNDEIDAVAQLVELHLRFHGYGVGEWTDSAVRRYVRDAGDQLERLHMLTRADCTTRNQRKADRLRRTYDDLEERIARLSEEEELASIRPDLDGNQIMAILGIGPGPRGRRGLPVPARAAPRPGPARARTTPRAALLRVVGRASRGWLGRGGELLHEYPVHRVSLHFWCVATPENPMEYPVDRVFMGTVLGARRAPAATATLDPAPTGRLRLGRPVNRSPATRRRGHGRPTR